MDRCGEGRTCRYIGECVDREVDGWVGGYVGGVWVEELILMDRWLSE